MIARLYPVAALLSLCGRGLEIVGEESKDPDYVDLCPSAPEIVILQDSSNSLKEVGKELTEKIKETILEFKEGFPGEVKLGFTTFTDKPLPLRGWGHQNYFMNVMGGPYDTCYDFGSGLTADPEEIEKAYSNIRWRNGGDLPEAQYEALMYAAQDPAMNWTPLEVEKDEEGRRISRIAVVITDDISHKAGDAFNGISHYNAPFGFDYRGGWGSMSLLQFPAAIYTSNGDDTYDPEEYKILSEMEYHKQMGYAWDDEWEALLYDYYVDVFGPKKVPHVGLHDGKFNLESCHTKEYPALSQVKNALQAQGITPVFLVTMPKNNFTPEAEERCIQRYGFEASKTNPNRIESREEKLRCLKVYYQRTLFENGIEAVVESFSKPDEVVATLKKVVLRAADHSCKSTTTTTAIPTDPPTTETPDDETTAHEDPIVPPPAPPIETPTDGGSSGGSNIGVIAGAAGGAVAGAAVLGGILYKTLGGALFGGNKTPDLDALEQVETPDSPVERETLEEVTMDMFQ